eukprot:TRINITY_DN40623_c0_g1_i1.p1 TRINITY_DN40623_c0_g1~~TRINITY_DN40623_c0_g1_i1.p1  ORF type:complete len:784 (-),score=68.76 TRINITY_DN40623_c0_g1_i1:115-2466(-)
MQAHAVWLVARLGHRLDECARSVRAALALAPECRVLLIGDGSCFVVQFGRQDLDGCISEAEVLSRIEGARQNLAQESSSVKDAVHKLASPIPTEVQQLSAPKLLVLDESATEDWSWQAPDLQSAIICLGVHEDFVDEIEVIKAQLNDHLQVQSAQLGPVALHSSACLHLLASVRQGPPVEPFAPHRPALVQAGCVPDKTSSARSLRRALPRRQPVRYVLRLQGHPLESPVDRAEAHQAIIASCLASKSAYDERDTRLVLVWPAMAELRAVAVDRSLLACLGSKVMPSESSVLEALEVQLRGGDSSFEDVINTVREECSRIAFEEPIAIRVLRKPEEHWPEWRTQQGWPTDTPLLIFLGWPGALPVEEAASIAVPEGSPARALIVLQHWHTLGVVPAYCSPRPMMDSLTVPQLVDMVSALQPIPGQDVKLDTLVKLRGCAARRLRMGHVMFVDFGEAKAMCKDKIIGRQVYNVVLTELQVGDEFHCEGYPGREFGGSPVIFVTRVLGIQPGQRRQQQQQEQIADDPEVYKDKDVVVMFKPAGMVSCEDARHRQERGTAISCGAKHFLAAAELELSGPAIFAWSDGLKFSHERRTYLVLVAGRPKGTTCRVPLRPRQGLPKEDATTEVAVLWQGDECSLVKAVVEGPEIPKQVRRHLRIMGFPVFGDRIYGDGKANRRARGVYGLVRPWCHLAEIQLSGGLEIQCSCAVPAELRRVLVAVGCQLAVEPEKHFVVRSANTAGRVGSVDVAALGKLEHGSLLQAYCSYRSALTGTHGPTTRMPWSFC